MKPTLVIDFDALLFKACCAVEKRSVKIINKITQEEFVRPNISSFWGRGKSIGAELLEINKSRTTPYEKDDFIIADIQEVEDFDIACSIVKGTIKKYCHHLNTTTWYGYVGGQGNFRETEATLIPYKQNRSELIKPLYYDQMKDYLVNTLGVESVHNREVDDQISTDCYSAYRVWVKTKSNKDKIIGVVEDKDYRGNPGWFYYPERDFEEFLIEDFGSLVCDEGVILGQGRLWKYYQFFGDKTDGFSANYHSKVKFGDKSAYKALKDCHTDKMCLESIIQTYKMLYPEPFEIVNFRGDLVEVNYFNMLQENILFAHLERWEGDRINLKTLLDNLGVKYDD